jgi:hypothetical protein
MAGSSADLGASGRCRRSACTGKSSGQRFVCHFHHLSRQPQWPFAAVAPDRGQVFPYDEGSSSAEAALFHPNTSHIARYVTLAGHVVLPWMPFSDSAIGGVPKRTCFFWVMRSVRSLSDAYGSA